MLLILNYDIYFCEQNKTGLTTPKRRDKRKITAKVVHPRLLPSKWNLEYYPFMVSIRNIFLGYDFEFHMRLVKKYLNEETCSWIKLFK